MVINNNNPNLIAVIIAIAVGTYVFSLLFIQIPLEKKHLEDLREAKDLIKKRKEKFKEMKWRTGYNETTDDDN